MALLQQTELWLALAFVLLLALLMQGNGRDKKRLQARLQRVTRHGPIAAATEQRLRKRDPNADSRLSQALANFSISANVQARLTAAGLEMPLSRLAIRALALALAFALLMLVLGKPLLLALLVGALAGIGLPHLYLARRVKKRKLQFLKLFPEGIDLIVRGLRAGLPVAESFIVVSREIPAPVGEVFFTISQQTGLGVPMEKALADTARKLDMTEFNFFVTTIILQRETGGNLGEILNNLSEVLRARQMMKLKIGALSSEARASGMIVGALPFFVFGILSVVSPDYLKPLFNDFRGNLSLAAAIGMMVFGAVVMRRMTQLEI
jgi:tight adherence protein B